MIWSNSWNWGLENPIKNRFLVQLDNSTYAETVKKHPDIIAKYAMFSALIQEYISERIVRDIDAVFLMTSMFSLITSMVNHLALFPEQKNDPSFIEHAWDMFYNYLKP